MLNLRRLPKCPVTALGRLVIMLLTLGPLGVAAQPGNTNAGSTVYYPDAAWEHRQLALGRSLLARCREIGNSSQFSGTFRPGDPRLIFGLYSPGN